MDKPTWQGAEGSLWPTAGEEQRPSVKQLVRIQILPITTDRAQQEILTHLNPEMSEASADALITA